MLDTLDALAARRWAAAALLALGHAREEIDALNVYPVPDGDTGTNLYLTVESACAAVRAVPRRAPMRTVVDAFATGALLGARGNSGIITAQLLRAWAEVLGEHGVLDAAAARTALRRADSQAWSAVGEPVEGTLLSVSRAAAQAGEEAGDSLGEVVTAAARAAREALARTPEQLPMLKAAGVVDAGGRGLVVLLDTLEDLVHERSPSRPARGERPPALPSVTAADPGCPDAHGPVGGPAYEVMYLLDAADAGVATLRGRLSALGDSLVVVGGGGLWHVHVHVDDAGAAIEAALDCGRPHGIRITSFAEQAGRPGAGGAGARTRAGLGPAPEGSGGSGGGPGARKAVGLVACAAGPGLARLFREAGAEVVEGGPGNRPATGALLDAVRRTGADSVVVLPNDPDTLAVARAAASRARADGIRVTVLPTRAQVQGLAAAAVHDPKRSVDDDVVQMSAAAGAARDGAVTVAAREAITSAGVCRVGDALGVVQGDFVVVGRDLARVAVQVLDRLLATGGELVTLVTGQDADADLVAAVTGHLRGTRRDVEVVILDGGQARYPLLLGVE